MLEQPIATARIKTPMPEGSWLEEDDLIAFFESGKFMVVQFAEQRMIK